MGIARPMGLSNCPLADHYFRAGQAKAALIRKSCCLWGSFDPCLKLLTHLHCCYWNPRCMEERTTQRCGDVQNGCNNATLSSCLGICKLKVEQSLQPGRVFTAWVCSPPADIPTSPKGLIMRKGKASCKPSIPTAC